MPVVNTLSICHILAGMFAGKGYVDVSTVDAETSQAVADAIHKAGGLYLEAPVSGSKGPAEQGTLIFLTAGEAGAGFRVLSSSSHAMLHCEPDTI